MDWGVKCGRCGASRDYIKNTKTGYKCSLCGYTWKRYRVDKTRGKSMEAEE